MVTQKFLRLNKYISQSEIASRRKADELIQAGQVKVNGKVVHELGLKVDPLKDQVRVANKIIRPQMDVKYFMFNKPQYVLSTLDDPTDRVTVAEYFKNLKIKVFPVGRLDWDSEGLLLLTNDGDFAQAVIHPSREVPKTYLVKVSGHVPEERLKKLKRGVTIPGGKVKALQVEKVRRGSDQYDWIRIVIGEGKNRQIRHMFAKIGFDVKKLQRVAIGQLRLGKLRKGEYRELDPVDLQRVFKPIFEPSPVKKKPVHRKKTSKKMSKKDYFKQLNAKKKEQL